MSIAVLRKSESAVSAVVSAVLILGLVVSIITVVNVSYVPEWRTGVEQAHMDEVFYDMASMKSDIDILSAIIDTDASSTISVSSPIRMGGGNIPIVSPGKSSGNLRVNSADLSMRTSSTDGVVSYSSDSFLENLGTIEYHSRNNNFVDQIYHYECGALILAQEDLSLMKQSPAIEIGRTDNNTNITFDISAIQLSGDGKTISSSSIEEIHSKYSSSSTLYASENLFTEITLTIDTKYPKAWETFLIMKASQAGLSDTEYTISSNDTSVMFYLEGQAGQDIKANIRKTVFDASLNVFEY